MDTEGLSNKYMYNGSVDNTAIQSMYCQTVKAGVGGLIFVMLNV